jgi:AraC-like DNA-binding protein
MPDPDPERLLEFLDVQVEAFAICEIDRNCGLAYPPLESVLVYFVLEGEGAIECEHGRYEMRVGRVLLVPRNLAARIEGPAAGTEMPEGAGKPPMGNPAPGMILACGSISVGLGGLPGLFDRLDRPYLQECEDGPLPLLLAAMAPELRRPRTGTQAMIEALMKQILIVLLRSPAVEHLAESPLRLLLKNVHMGRAVRAVIASPQDPHSVDSLAALAGVSRSCLNRQFSASYGCSPMGFVHTVRMRAAARMLMGSDLPVKSVAAAVGYASRSHFSRAFAAQYGSDPSQYRRHCGAQTTGAAGTGPLACSMAGA